ncbi:MAG: hypothetical protein IJW70_10460 [Clostridia bacterium]|nr:hypothetical protein [Clostridia bacterium]
MKKTRILCKTGMTVGAFAILLLCALGVMPVFSIAILPYAGVESFGIYPAGGASCLQVEQLCVTYDLQDFPEKEFESRESFLAYSASVTSEYVFYNPTNQSVMQQMLVPCGALPIGAGHLYSDQAGLVNPQAYSVTADGQKIDYELRYSYVYHNQRVCDGAYGLLYDAWGKTGPALSDDLLEHQFLSPDLPVTVYTYTYDGAKQQGAEELMVYSEPIRPDPSSCWVLAEGISYASRSEEGYLMAARVSTDEVFRMYVLGASMDAVEWKSDAGISMTLTDTSSITLYDLAMQHYNAQSGVSRTDWYNAVLTMLQTETFEGIVDPPETDMTEEGIDLTQYLQCWLTYELTLAPGGRVTNAVSATVIPEISATYTPEVYCYAYDTQSFSCWDRMGQVTVTVNTLLEITDATAPSITSPALKQGYTLTEDDYEYACFSFALSSTKTPGNVINASVIWGAVAIFAAVIAAPALIFGVLVLLFKNKKCEK